MSNNTSACVDSQLHFADLLVNVCHELDDEVDQLVLEHSFGVEVGHQEADVITLDGLPPEDDKVFSALRQEAHEHLTQDSLEFVSLLDANANTDGVDRTLNQHLFTLVSADNDRVQQQFLVSPGLNFGLVVSLYYLGGEVLETHRSGQSKSDSIQVRSQSGSSLERQSVKIRSQA